METRTFSRDLPVRLTEDELQLYGKLLAEKVREEDAIDVKRKQIAKEYGTELSKVRGEQSRLAEARSKGVELRPVVCTERWHGGVIEIIRTDTMEVVDSRPVTLADQQTSIPGLEEDGDGSDAVPFRPLDQPGAASPPRQDAPGFYAGVETAAAPSAADADAEDVGDAVETTMGDQVFVAGGVDGEDDAAMAVHTHDDDDDIPAFDAATDADGYTPEPLADELSEEDREIEEAHAKRTAAAKAAKESADGETTAAQDKAKAKADKAAAKAAKAAKKNK